jgi:hypothetical protein
VPYRMPVRGSSSLGSFYSLSRAHTGTPSSPGTTIKPVAILQELQVLHSAAGQALISPQRLDLMSNPSGTLKAKNPLVFVLVTMCSTWNAVYVRETARS